MSCYLWGRAWKGTLAGTRKCVHLLSRQLSIFVSCQKAFAVFNKMHPPISLVQICETSTPVNFVYLYSFMKESYTLLAFTSCYKQKAYRHTDRQLQPQAMTQQKLAGSMLAEVSVLATSCLPVYMSCYKLSTCKVWLKQLANSFVRL